MLALFRNAHTSHRGCRLFIPLDKFCACNIFRKAVSKLIFFGQLALHPGLCRSVRLRGIRRNLLAFPDTAGPVALLVFCGISGILFPERVITVFIIKLLLQIGELSCEFVKAFHVSAHLIRTDRGARIQETHA